MKTWRSSCSQAFWKGKGVHCERSWINALDKLNHRFRSISSSMPIAMRRHAFSLCVLPVSGQWHHPQGGKKLYGCSWFCQHYMGESQKRPGSPESKVWLLSFVRAKGSLGCQGVLFTWLTILHTLVCLLPLCLPKTHTPNQFIATINIPAATCHLQMGYFILVTASEMVKVLATKASRKLELTLSEKCLKFQV